MNSFWANTEKNTKEECKVIFTGSQRRENAKKEKRAKGVLEDVSNDDFEDMRLVWIFNVALSFIIKFFFLNHH